MKIHEYEARNIFERTGIPVPKAILATNMDEVVKAASELRFPVVLKAQVLVAGRGKAGGIRTANDLEEAIHIASSLFGSPIKGILVKKILVAERVEAIRELYIGFTIDRGKGRPVLIASPEGGMDLEEISKRSPSSVCKHFLDPFVGMKPYVARKAAKDIGLPESLIPKFVTNCSKMYGIFTQFDCELIESNPLVISNNGDLVALDTRMVIDDNALFRQASISRSEEDLTEVEREAAEEGLSFVQMDGNIGIIGNGAGLVMATLDIVVHFGGKPANFLDIGGGARRDVVERAIKIVTQNIKVKSVFVNILGGITRCDEVAEGIVAAARKSENRVPFVVRLVGTNEEEGKKILDEAGIAHLDSMEEGARKAVAYAALGSR
jgi:succinyl-CoA synthetase beta subunit